MAKSGNYVQMKAILYLFLTAVMLQLLSVNATHGTCLHEDETCDPKGTPCCETEGLSCVEVENGVHKCEPSCEDHVGHSCDSTRPCCDGLECNSSNQCECVLKLGDSCVPGIDTCCDLDCVPGVNLCAGV